MASKEQIKSLRDTNTYEMRNQFINDERLKAFRTIKKALLRWLLKLKTVPLAMILRDTLVHLIKEKKPERKMHSLVSPHIFPVKTKRQPE
ncbi:MAG: hypothetical protein ABF629_02265 [Sporolactobacillus sp.]|uniref:Uncharacterized protein n=1 Tax=Terrilactibacillus tamarindi TaxID=2599694 RepID=A0A6N8CPR9_9BACI|nr:MULTISPECIES: hypothetical protein [Bacillales]MCQ2010372.1 hypothetical protein [Sporolactobacillus sp. STSJ-5]MTT31610.1 hypothetical protein [Terrilactibacillus tamarindi]